VVVRSVLSSEERGACAESDVRRPEFGGAFGLIRAAQIGPIGGRDATDRRAIGLGSKDLDRHARPVLRRILAALHVQAEPRMLTPGSHAPAFEVTDHLGRIVRSRELAGKRWILWFYPKADTPG
jgi:hypothetical protein